MQREALPRLASALLLSACWGAPVSNATGGAGSGGAGELTAATSTGSAVASTAGTGGASATTTASAGGSGGSGVCTATLVGGPEAASYPFTLGGQTAWSHDDGFPAGYVHTYDALDVGGPGDAPHKVHVLVPRDYGPCDAGYPVAYFNDGNSTFWNGGAANQSWDVPDALDTLYQAGAIPKMIVVAIEPNDRNYEYSHVPWSADGACCGADEYVAYLADHLKAFIDQNYRTQPGRAATAIIGSSRGGLSSFYVATRRPDVFGKAGCLSSSFWVGLDPVYGGTFSGGPLATAPLVVGAQSTLTNAAIRPRLWIDWGLVRTGGFANAVIEDAATKRGKEMVALLKGTYGYAEGSEIFWEEDPLGAHDENSWARRVPDVLKALFGP